MYKKTTLILLLLGFLLQFAVAQRPRYGSNIIRLTPLSGFGQSFNEADGHLAIGMSYEHILGRQKRIGIYFPFYYGQNTRTFAIGANGIIIENYSFLWNPGVKFYPFGHRRLDYAFGPSIFTAYGDASSYLGMGVSEVATYRKSGIMINNYLHFNCTPLFNIGLELAMGTSLINKHKPANKPEVRQGSAPFYKIGFQLGFRF